MQTYNEHYTTDGKRKENVAISTASTGTREKTRVPYQTHQVDDDDDEEGSEIVGESEASGVEDGRFGSHGHGWGPSGGERRLLRGACQHSIPSQDLGFGHHG